MEETNYAIIALIVGVAMALIEAGKHFLGLFFKYLNGDKSKAQVDNQQAIAIALLGERYDTIITKLDEIESNDLLHIQKDLEKNTEEHTDIKLKMVSMDVKLDNILKILDK